MLRDNVVDTERLNQNSDGILIFYDRSRSVWISISREVISFGIDHRNISSSRWMQMSGKVLSNTSGYKIPRDGIITSISIQSQNNTTCDFRIRKNGNTSNLHTTSLTNQSGKSDDNLNININSDDWLQVLLDINNGDIDYPVLSIEVAWR